MTDRKEMKRRARVTVKRHYWLLVIASLLAAVLGVSYTGTTGVLQALRANYPAALAENGTTTVAGIGNVWSVLAEGNILEGTALANTYTKEAMESPEREILGVSVGRTRGILAQAVNTVASGDVLVELWSAIYNLIHSEGWVSVIFVVLSLGVFLFVRMLVGVYSAIFERVLLEARVYEKVPISRFTHLFRVKKWFKVALTLFLTGVLELLWGLTIVGGVIMAMAYSMVPQILAENPDLNVRQAAGLSRRMMRGHKWELFKLELSFIGWIVLSIVTLGLAGIFYFNPYNAATVAEFYAELRRTAKRNGVEGAELLNDEYLFKKASRSKLKHAYPEAARRRYVPIKRLPGLRGFLADNLGVVLGIDETERENQLAMENNAVFEAETGIMSGRSYPAKLFSIPETPRLQRLRNTGYMRRYTVFSLVLIFFIFSVGGWLWEVTLHILQTGDIVNRGVLHGPWLPIYGIGCVMILTLLYRFRTKPWLQFTLAMLLCGVLEYLASYILEAAHNGLKWWDYSGYFLNLNGRICAEGLLVFGIAAVISVYAVAPILDDYLSRIRQKTLLPLSLAILIAFSADGVYSVFYPNTGRGITDIETAEVEPGR